MKFIRLAIGFIALAIITGALIWRTSLSHVDPPPVPPAAPPVDQPAKPSLRIVVTTSHTFVCSKGSCTATARPPAADAVTDGEWWYYYEEAKQEAIKTYLRRKHNKSGKVETIMESTPLTSPRGLFVSPDGSHVAFWLDNIAQPVEELTELWVYDVAEGGIRLLGEKVHRPDVRSEVFWNSQSTYLWFIGDTREQNLEPDVLELIHFSVDEPGKKAAFPNVTWPDLTGISSSTIDLAQRADKLAYATTTFLGHPQLLVQAAHDKQRTTLRGAIKSMQWLEDGRLLYALQDAQGFTFWQVREGTHRFVARRPGELMAARSDLAGRYLVFASQNRLALQLFSLDLDSGAVTEEGRVPLGSGEASIQYVAQQPDEASSKIPDITAPLADDELAAFVEKNFSLIVGAADSLPLRLIMTEEENTIFLDYRKVDGQEYRLQLRVHDAINTDWSIAARYEPRNREWKKIQGGLPDPSPTRLYEWEESLGQWVLKEQLTTDN